MVILLIPVSPLRNHAVSDIITLSNKRVRYKVMGLITFCGAHRYANTGAARFLFSFRTVTRICSVPYPAIAFSFRFSSLSPADKYSFGGRPRRRTGFDASRLTFAGL